MKFNLDSKIFHAISDEAEKLHTQAFMIGGCVRDLCMGRIPKDIDIVVRDSSIALAQNVARTVGAKVSIFKTYGTASFCADGCQFEFVTAKSNSYGENTGSSIEDDRLRRDLTINTMSISLQKENFGELSDPLGGMEDIKKGLIRTPSDPDRTFTDDPLRMIRAVRFATVFGFNIQEETAMAIRRNSRLLQQTPVERITAELEKIISSTRPAEGIKLLDRLELLDKFLPELTVMKGVERHGNVGHKDIFLHTMGVLERLAKVSDKLYLRWAAILHDIGKPKSKRYDQNTGFTFHGHEVIGAKMIPGIFKRLKLPMDERMKYVQKLVSLHLRPIILAEDIVTDSAVRRVLFEAGDDIEDLMTLCEADVTSANEAKVNRIMDGFAVVRTKLVEIEKKDHIRNFNPPITGEIIMERYGIPPCRIIGDIKTVIKDAILDGIIPNEYEAAYALMEQTAKQMGLS